MPVATHPPRARVLGALAKRWHLGVVALVAAAVATPVAMLAHGTSRARACIAGYEAPRGPELPECRGNVRWFVAPSRIPWTATAARYRAEELNARVAIAAYFDAAIGKPDAAALARSIEDVAQGEKVLKNGSQRLALEELGRAVGAPDAGRSAMLVGDRRNLLARADFWLHWSLRMRTLEAALLEGNPKRAFDIAKRYADWDPRDEGLRLTVAGLLCLGDDPKRGLYMLDTIQNDRAKGRHENWTQSWGEVRAMIAACAARHGLQPPALPARSDGGSADLAEARAALRLRLLVRAGETDTSAIRDAGDTVVQMLQGGPVSGGARVHLLAALLAARPDADPALLATLATPRRAEGEPALMPTPAELTAVEWLAPGRGMRATASAQALRDAAAKLCKLSTNADLGEVSRLALVNAAGATALHAARALALAGDAAAAEEILDRTRDCLGGAVVQALARSSAWYVAGDPAKALDRIDAIPGTAHGGPRDRSSPIICAEDAARAIQRAEILASLGRRDDAARAAEEADTIAATCADRGLDIRAQWTRLALARTRRDKTPPPSGRAFPWTSPMGTPSSWLEPVAEGAVPFAQALAFWDAARGASPEERRALRYAVFHRHAGDTPRSRAPLLVLASELLRPGEGDVEIWLDAFAVTSARSTTLRGYAWSRMEAARFRGDAEAAAAWHKRYRALLELAAPADNAEIAAALGI